MSSAIDEVIRESATAVLLRDSTQGPEVLMLKKNSKINYGGSWVFPGGVAEQQDSLQHTHLAGEPRRIQVAQTTVIRETLEETGLKLEASQLKPFSNWLTPKIRIKRYNTLFFVTLLSSEQAQQAVEIDAEEIVDYQWIDAATAIEAQAEGSLLLNGPSFVTLKKIENQTSAKAAINALVGNDIYYYEPRGFKTDTGVATLYRGDCAYDLADLNHESTTALKGVRHRLYMHKAKPWEFLDTR